MYLDKYVLLRLRDVVCGIVINVRIDDKFFYILMWLNKCFY